MAQDKTDKDCIFCKIVDKSNSAHIIDETDSHIAFMDVFPPTFEGKITMPTILVVSKGHLQSDVFEDLSVEEYHKLLSYTREIARAVKKALKCMRVGLVFEGMEINHIHSKLYPIFKETYPGYLSTKKSSNNESIRADDFVLEEYATKIKQTLTK